MASNFQRTFHQLPEAVALGLLDKAAKGKSKSSQPQQQMVQEFTRFLLQQLLKEEEMEAATYKSRHEQSAAAKARQQQLSPTSSNAHNLPGPPTKVIDSVFGYSLVSCTSSKSGSQWTDWCGHSRIKGFAVELCYHSPINNNVKHKRKSALKPPPSPISFAYTLWTSLRRESYMRGWIPETSSYEPLCQLRSLDVSTIGKVLTIMCGDTLRDPRQDIVGVLLGEKQTGAMNSSEDHRPQRFWQQQNRLGGPWLSDEIELVQRSEYPEATGDSLGSLIISVRLRDAQGALTDKWLVYDGSTESLQDAPASVAETISTPSTDDVVVRLHLLSVVSQVMDNVNVTPVNNEYQTQRHVVHHVCRRIPVSSNLSEDEAKWVLINDLATSTSSVQDAMTFAEWKNPCILFYKRHDYKIIDRPYPAEGEQPTEGTASPWDLVSVPSSVLHLKSMSNVHCVPVHLSQLPGPGALVAFDAEFVTVELQQNCVDDRGYKQMSEESRQILARISLIDATGGGSGRLIVDDYVLPTEKVLDYVTRYSGLTPDDLVPDLSDHAVVSQRAAYLKLRHIVDRGCVLVGHGLQKVWGGARP